MALDLLLSLNIRQKVVLAMTLGLLTVLAIGGTSYRYVLEIEKKHRLSGEADLAENQRYIAQARDMVERIAPALSTPKMTLTLSKMREEMTAFTTEMAAIARCLEKRPAGCQGAEERIRKRGKNRVEITQALRLIAGQVPARIRIDTEVEEITLPMDSREMQEVLINLIINAVQAIPEGVGYIAVTGRRLPGGTFAEIRVEDTGAGISESDLDKIFDPFFTTKEPDSGTGLGLSIAYGIVKQHQGHNKATHRPEGGTRIAIRLPLVLDLEEAS